MKIDNLKNLTENKVLIYSLFLTVLVLSIVSLIRFFYYDNIVIGEQPYYNIRMAKHILENGFPLRDPLVDSPYLFQPFHFVLAGFSSLFGVSFASFLLPILSGLISVLLFYLILKELKVNCLNKLASLFILIISPIFVYTFSILNSYSLSIVVLLLAFFLFIKKQKIFFVLSLVFFVLISFFNFLSIVFGLAIILIYSLNYKNKIKKFYYILWAVVLISLIRYLIYLIKYGIPYISLSSDILINYIAELGGLISFGVFNIILFGIGLYIKWKKKKQILGYIFLFTAIIFSFYFNSINIYLNFIFALFAGSAFVFIIKMRYSLAIIKKLMLGLLLFGLIFSTVSYTARISTLLPDNKIIDSLNWLKENTEPEDIIFSHYTKGNWIEAIAERPVLLDINLLYIEDVKAKLNDSEIIFYSRNLKRTLSLFEKHDVSYVWIDSDMKKNLVWFEEEGLLFLFSDRNMFRKVYDKDGIEIWELRRENFAY
ncbi:hypothetical protein KY342_04050 [Candidatus Woesearchaeota archaeon]|nr:hypothetical protein [Candidatus Woesearchaeota archaeon]